MVSSSPIPVLTCTRLIYNNVLPVSTFCQLLWYVECYQYQSFFWKIKQDCLLAAGDFIQMADND